MRAYTDKSQEKYRQTTAGEMTHKAGQEIPNQFRDRRPEAAAQRRVQQLANDNARVRQLKALQAMARTSVQTRAAGGTPKNSRAHVDKASHVRAPDNQAVIQGRFTGRLGSMLGALTPAALGAAGTYYNNLWNALNSSPMDIKVENADGMANFDPTTNTLSLKFQILKELLDHRSGIRLPQNVLADHIALITHELSHAHDSLVENKELKGEHGTDGALAKIANVMMTEVQAWEREARTRQRLLPGGQDDPLWDGWFNLEPAMLADFGALKAHKGTNEVVNRYYRYLVRELQAEDGDVGRVGTWFAEHGATVSAEMMRLATALVQARDTI